MKRIYFITLLTIVTGMLFGQTDLYYRITPWYNGKKAAFSPTFDDNLPNQFSHCAPAMALRGIHGSFYIITNEIGGTITWYMLQDAINHGHEVGSHTVTAPTNLIDLDTATQRTELKNSYLAIKNNLTNQSAITIAWPSGKGGASSAKDIITRSIADDYYIGARNADVPGGYNLYNQWSTWSGYTNYYLQVKSFSISSTVTIGTFTSTLNNCINDGGWFVPMYHSVNDGGYANITEAAFDEQMDTVKNRAENLWLATFGDANRYHHQRRTASLTETNEDTYLWVLTLSDSLTADSLFNHPLTLRIKKPTWTIDSIVQGGKKLAFTEETDTIQVNAIPDAGNITFYKNVGTSIKKSTKISQSLEVHPNPVTSNAVITVTLERQQEIELSILDITGKNIRVIQKGFANAGKNQYQLTSSDIKAGIYILELKTPAGTITRKLVVK